MKRRSVLTSLVLLALSGWYGTSGAQSPTAHYWYDGDNRRSLWIDGASIADFSRGQGRRDQVLRAAPGAQVKSLSAPGSGGSTNTASDAKLSPLFRDAAASDAAERALPGGVIVGLKQAMDVPTAKAWLAAQGLTPVQPIGGTGLWLVDAPTGIDSLTLANRLYESGLYSRATPNWWRPRALK